MAERLPRAFGRYRLVERFRGAGMSAVYLALNTGHENKRCVIKQLPEQLADDDGLRARFEREISIIARLDSPYIVDTFDSGVIDGTPFLAMPYIGGGHVGDLIRTEPLPPRDVADVVEQVGWALDAAHRHEPPIAHRDIKPANVLVRERPPGGRLHTLVSDFGLARPEVAGAGLTVIGTAVGTYPYMAPERFRPMTENDDWLAVDVYALACVAYECVTGRRAFPASSGSIEAQHRNATRPRVSEYRPAFRACDDTIAHGLAVRPDDRPSPTEFAAALSNALDDVPTTGGASPRRRADGRRRTPASGEPTVAPEPPRRSPVAGAFRVSRTNVVGAATMAAVALGGAVAGTGLVPHVLATLAAYGLGAIGARLVGRARRDREGSRTAEGNIGGVPTRHHPGGPDA